MASISSLPAEILAHIFTIGPLTLSSNPSRTLSPAFAVTLVCRRWCAIALSTPTLWCDLDFDFMITAGLHTRKVNHHAGTRLHQFAKLCVARSSGRPLSVRFQDDFAMVPLLERPGETIAATSARWRTVHVPSFSLSAILNHRDFNGFAALRSLSVVGPLDESKSANLASAVGLTKLCLGEENAGSITAFPLARVTDLIVALPSTLHLNMFLMRLPPKLASLQVSIGAAPDFFTPAAKLSSLTSLTISGTRTTEHAWLLLSHFELPALRHLCVRDSGVNIPDAAAAEEAAFNSFLQMGRMSSTSASLLSFGTDVGMLSYTLRLVEIAKPRNVKLYYRTGPSAHRADTLCAFLERVVEGDEGLGFVRDVVVYDGGGTKNPRFVEEVVAPLQRRLGDLESPCAFKRNGRGRVRRVVVESEYGANDQVRGELKELRARLPVGVQVHVRFGGR